MTTHWTGTLNEESSLIPAHARAPQPARRLGASAPPRREEFLLTLEANEIFLAFLEPMPDFSHCGINE